jgi:hypothetical protein
MRDKSYFFTVFLQNSSHGSIRLKKFAKNDEWEMARKEQQHSATAGESHYRSFAKVCLDRAKRIIY